MVQDTSDMYRTLPIQEDTTDCLVFILYFEFFFKNTDHSLLSLYAITFNLQI